MKRIRILFVILLALLIVSCAPAYTINHSVPVNPISFPDDAAAHYWAQTEWWYYTGHLKAEDGKEYGYELTFFKRLTNEDKVPGFFIPVPAYWFKDVGMIGHFALTDLSNKKFKAKEISNIFNKSKADAKKYDVVIDKWTARDENGKHILRAEMKGCSIDLELESFKPAALHEQNGIVNKGGTHSNYYYSYTNMKTSGTLTLEGKPVKVDGKSWMDHEYGTMKMAYPQVGWDWFSVQLDNNHELMLFSIRDDKDKNNNHVGGTFVLPDGKTIPIKKEDIDVKVLDYWHSDKTDSDYPALWELTVKSLDLKLKVNPLMPDQELDLKPVAYWEGSVRVDGTFNNAPVQGEGYVELVGYSKKYPLVYF
ncbi:MAG: lipocalin-like domain-containing protein [Smithella sp.]|jgi:predicted secreted hydrolase